MASNIGASSASLKQQFSNLQEQQQKKLARLKQRKESQQQAKEAEAVKLLTSQAFGVDDDLALKLADPPTSGSAYSEELVNHLNSQIRELKDETGRLYKLLSERDLEVRQLRKKREQDKALIEAGASGVSNDAAAVKIVELSKKIREMTAELESEKTKSRQLTRKCNDLEQKMSKIPTEDNNKGSCTSLRTISLDDGYQDKSSTDEVKALQEKLHQSELRLSEQRNQCQSLRQELKMAQKVLSQEVGDNVSVQSLLGGSSGWRGRAQQIIALQKKVNELKSHLDENRLGSRAGLDRDLDRDLEDQFMGSATSRYSSVDERGRDKIRKMEKERKEAQEKMAGEMKALEQDYESLKNKFEASKARNKVLANELKAVKQQMSTLLEKGKHDDELISALLKQQEQLKSAVADNARLEQQIEDQKLVTMQKLSMKGQQESNIVEQLKAIVAEKENKVRALEQEVEQVKLASLQKTQLNGVNALFEQHASRPSTATTAREESMSVIAEVVDNYMGSPVPSAREGSPGVSCRPHSVTTDRPPSRKSSARAGSLSKGVDSHQAEDLRLQCQEYKSLYQAATVERDRLTELVKVLEQRTSELTESASEFQNDLIAQRRKNAQLEKQLGKAKIEQTHSGKRSRGKGVSASTVSLRESVALDEASGIATNLEELEVSLAIQRDENEALKAALQSTLKAKEEDLKLYNEMMEETKTVFLHGLRQYRQSQS